MIPTQPVCRHCDEPITDPETDGVIVHHELSNSGPGWDVWAHRDHAALVNVIGDDLLRIMLRIWTSETRT